jgi:flagellar biogenesis protein FliO
LGPRRAVYAVKAGGQVLLLGVAEHGITYLTQLPESAQTTGTGAAMGTISPIGAAAPFFTLLTERFTRRVNTAEENRPEPTPEIPEPVRKTKSSAAPRKKAANPI